MPRSVLSIGATRHALITITAKPLPAKEMLVTRSLQEFPMAKMVRPKTASLMLRIVPSALRTATTSLARMEQVIPKTKPRRQVSAL